MYSGLVRENQYDEKEKFFNSIIGDNTIAVGRGDFMNETIRRAKRFTTIALILWILANVLFLGTVYLMRSHNMLWLVEGICVILLLFVRYAIKDWLSDFISRNRKVYYAIRIPLVLVLAVIAFIMKEILINDPQYALIYVTEAILVAWIHDLLHARREIMRMCQGE